MHNLSLNPNALSAAVAR